MKNVIIFNGPPDSGKDYICDRMCNYFLENLDLYAQHCRFKDKLFELTTALFCVDEEKFFRLYNDRATKEVASDSLMNMSPRQALIFTSENCVKPAFGKDYFGKAAAKKTRDGFNFFSDGGFYDELIPMHDDGCKMLIIQLHREGRTFAGDSRSYIDEFRDVPVIVVHNDGTDRLLSDVLSVIYEHFRGEFESDGY